MKQGVIYNARLRAFSLIEIIVVIAVISILLSIVVPRMYNPPENIKKGTSTLSKLTEQTDKLAENQKNPLVLKNFNVKYGGSNKVDYDPRTLDIEATKKANQSQLSSIPPVAGVESTTEEDTSELDNEARKYSEDRKKAIAESGQPSEAEIRAKEAEIKAKLEKKISDSGLTDKINETLVKIMNIKAVIDVQLAFGRPRDPEVIKDIQEKYQEIESYQNKIKEYKKQLEQIVKDFNPNE